MSNFFIELLKLSVSASFLIVVVILLRLLMRKSPKSIYCVLWALVGIRLICPFSFESSFSVIPKEDVIPINTILKIPDTQSELVVPNTNNFVPNEIVFESENTLVTNKSINVVDIISGVWLVGTIGMALYGAISYIRLKRIVSVSINDKENIYLCDDIDVPFIFGIFKPKIYLPSNIKETEAKYVLLHEKAHLKRLDNIWKPVGFIIASIYWFNPLGWISYFLFRKDIELATDEKVIRDLETNDIKRYSETLLSCSQINSDFMIKTCPVAFGEVGVKDRIKAILNYKKPKFWIIILALLSCIVVAFCFLTVPKENDNDEQMVSNMSELPSQIIKNENKKIMGFDTYYIDTENSPHFFTRDYYTKFEGNDILIAESYGMEKERNDVVKDINGDGITELICNCVAGGDGHEEIYVFTSVRNSSSKEPSVLVGTINYEKIDMPGYFNWGVNSVASRYEVEKNRFVVLYSKGNAEHSETATIYINEKEIMDKLSFTQVIFAYSQHINLEPGTRYNLNALLLPLNIEGSVKYESSNEEIATVDNKGNVTILENAEIGAIVDIMANFDGNRTICRILVVEKADSDLNIQSYYIKKP